MWRLPKIPFLYTSHLMRLRHFDLVLRNSSNTHAQPFSSARCLIFFSDPSSTSILDVCEQRRRNLDWAFAVRLCDKYHNLMRLLKCKRIYMSRNRTKPTVTVRPAKTQTSLGTHPVWSETSLSAWRNIGPLTTYWAHSEYSDLGLRCPHEESLDP